MEYFRGRNGTYSGIDTFRGEKMGLHVQFNHYFVKFGEVKRKTSNILTSIRNQKQKWFLDIEIIFTVYK